MIAYTAWDSLQAIAHQYDADLTLVPGERLALAPHRHRCIALAAWHRLDTRVRARFAGRRAAFGQRASLSE